MVIGGTWTANCCMALYRARQDKEILEKRLHTVSSTSCTTTKAALASGKAVPTSEHRKMSHELESLKKRNHDLTEEVSL